MSTFKTLTSRDIIGTRKLMPEEKNDILINYKIIFAYFIINNMIIYYNNMTGGTMHLASIGIEDLFLTDSPQITFFKTVYRRYTNFSVESIEISPNGNVYSAGGSTSPNFPGVSVGNDLGNNGGLSDGYVARFNPSNGGVISATFMGANEYDQTYFVRCDPSNQVYVYGQTESNWVISPNCVGTPNSGQYIRKSSDW